MRILIGFDGSAGAKAAVSDLVRAGLPVDADVLVLAAADAAASDPEADVSTTADRVARAAYEAALGDAEAWADEGRRFVESVEPSWKVSRESEVGRPARTLVRRARSWRADLVVVGSTGRSPIGRRIFGSVAEQALRESPCAVRIGRGRPASERPGAERLVVGVDGSPGGDAAVAAVASRKWNVGSAVRVVTAVNSSALADAGRLCADGETPLAWLRTLNEIAVERLAAAGLEAAPILVDCEGAPALIAEADSWGADCVFVGAHGRRGAERALLLGVASAVAVRARCSVEIATAAPDGPAPALGRSDAGSLTPAR